MHQTSKKIPSWLSPILGAGAIGACPLCWIGSASLLTYIGLGALIPIWRWIILVFFVFGLVGFLLDYRSHHNFYPSLLLIIGFVLLYAGRYIWGGPGFGGWPIWGPGTIFVIIAIIYNKNIFYQIKKRHSEKQILHKI